MTVAVNTTVLSLVPSVAGIAVTLIARPSEPSASKLESDYVVYIPTLPRFGFSSKARFVARLDLSTL